MSKIYFFAFDILFSGHLRAEEIDSVLLRNDNGIESALSYAKAWSKYTKDIVAWVEKKLNLGEWFFLAPNELCHDGIKSVVRIVLQTVSNVISKLVAVH